MIDFQRLKAARRSEYEAILFAEPSRGCEYTFANLFLWGRQEVAFLHGCVAFFSHFYGRSVYPYPIGPGDKRAVLEDILADARQRGIPCRITNLTAADVQQVQQWFPDTFLTRTSRDNYDYVYAIDDLADLKGRKFQKKRNHVNRFLAEHPSCRTEPMTACNLGPARYLVNDWFSLRMRQDPEGDYLLENLAMAKAFQNYAALGFDGIMLLEEDKVLAVAMGTRMSEDTFDIHFEKAREDVDGAYAMVNQAFARYLREKYPQLRYLDREDDLGEEGLRKAKLSYHPHHLVEKYSLVKMEDLYGE